MTSISIDETERANRLLRAQAVARHFFDRIAAELIRPGVTESHLAHEIIALGRREFGLQTHWHKRIVRAGINTLAVYNENPPEVVIGEDDLVFVDLGPVFEDWEADFGRTFVLGDDPLKHRLCDQVLRAFNTGKRHFQAHPDITGAALFDFLRAQARRDGWEFGGIIAGHWVGEFPHKGIPEYPKEGIADAHHHRPMRALDSRGREQHWILEIHYVDRARCIGAFCEELLTLG
jgi:Xaa-Pro aminopeptidase